MKSIVKTTLVLFCLTLPTIYACSQPPAPPAGPPLAGPAGPGRKPPPARPNGPDGPRGRPVQQLITVQGTLNNYTASDSNLISDTTQIPLVLEWDRKSDSRATGRMLTEITLLDLRDSIATISSPLLVLGSWNGDTAFTSKQQAETAMRKQFTKVPGITIVYSDQGKHFLMWNDYNWFIGQIDAFLQKNKS